MADFKEFLRNIVVYLLTLEAKAIVRKYKPKVVMVTGSVGKTSSKDAAYTALSSTHFVRKSEKSFNSDVGVPLTILGVPNGWSNPVRWLKNLFEGLSLIFLDAPYPKWLVVEVGADRPGDITKSLSWLSPYVVLATRFPDVPVHVEYYKKPEDVVTEELAPVSWIENGGVAVVNADDAHASAVSVKNGVRKVSFGFNASADVRGMRYMVTSRNKVPVGVSFEVHFAGEKARVTLPSVVGRTHAQAVLAGIATAVAVGVPLKTAVAAFDTHEIPAGRTRLIAGVSGTTLIDDTYNSSPVASEEGLRALADIPRTGRRIAVLADMLELGAYSVSEHTRIGTVSAGCTDILVTVGVRARNIAEGARLAGMPPEQIIECDHGADAASKLLPVLQLGDVLLIKGSQSMRMERVVKTLMAEPEQAEKLLVRQDAEWLSRA